ncbi:MAG: DUF882 domain-containing protein [Synergistaceae bacterium]|nr:DUF882 domain-containing protein [Synergistaceae bacterium]
MAKDTKNFKVGEFACHCGKCENKIEQEIIDIAQKIRERAGCPIHINSGYRCPVHNKNVGGVANSKHTLGLAADLSCSIGAINLFVLIADMKAKGELPDLDYAILYIKKNFVHVDCGGKRSKFFEIRP